jgi:hypothetical protein
MNALAIRTRRHFTATAPSKDVRAQNSAAAQSNSLDWLLGVKP